MRSASPRARGRDVVRVGLGLVAGALLIRAGALHVVERVDDGERRLDALQLHLGDFDPRVLVVEKLLQQGEGLIRDLLALVRHRRLDRRAADDVAQRALRCDPDGELRVVDLEQELARVADFPEHGAVRFHDVFVPGQHLPAAVRLAVCGRGRCGADAELDLIDLGDLGQQHRVDRVGHMDMQAGVRRLDPFAEAQDDALFVRLDAVESCREPCDDHDADERRDAAPVEPGHAEDVAEARPDDAPHVERRGGGIVFRRRRDLARVNLVQRPGSPRATSAPAPAISRSRSSVGRRRRECRGRAACAPGSRSLR